MGLYRNDGLFIFRKIKKQQTDRCKIQLRQQHKPAL